MAKPKASKQRDSESSKSRFYLTADSAIAKRYRHAAVDLDLSESELFERMVTMLFGAVHARGVSDSVRAAILNGAGQGSGAPIDQTPPTVRIQTVTNRIGDIARKSAAPVDDAIDDIANESA